MIASERGLEYGFAAVTLSWSDFSKATIKDRLRQAAPALFRLLPGAETDLARSLEAHLWTEEDGWTYRRKARLQPNETDFASLSAWLTHMRGTSHFRSAGGNISRYLLGEEIDRTDLPGEMRQMAILFKPLMVEVRASRGEASGHSAPAEAARRTFAKSLTRALSEFDAVRSGPFAKVPQLWSAMDEVVASVSTLRAMRSRPHVFVKWSVGKGVWAKVPWIALRTERYVFNATGPVSRLPRFLKICLGFTSR